MDGFLNYIQPFNRYTNAKMLEDLKYPSESTTLYQCGQFLRDVYDLHHGILGIMYSVLVTAVITDSIKDAVGRPHPNLFYRRLTEEAMLQTLHCYASFTISALLGISRIVDYWHHWTDIFTGSIIGSGLSKKVKSSSIKDSKGPSNGDIAVKSGCSVHSAYIGVTAAEEELGI
ncbi:hypothetical protein K7X08_031555 [Anisodus acutangulus]|uniref:Phosphatidic acid phosphatase type 2/haloperoxidase domain-containing protein n=1 Tax=Anisodus acutangulus TaxID=402998 RepID=A0A9Q1RJF0_9SOLA|nr:hypothetical protein K7X08_031555 [Anisodus acutangulus]